MTHVAWRVVGVTLTAITLLGYDAQSPSPVHLLLLPLAMALGAWMIIRNAAAVLLALATLAAIHSDTSSPGWVISRAYPIVALLGGSIVIGIAAQRFHRQVLKTRDARWKRRRKLRRRVARQRSEPEVPRAVTRVMLSSPVQSEKRHERQQTDES